MKVLGASSEEAGKLLQVTPPGTPPWWAVALKEYRKGQAHRKRPLRDLKVGLTLLYSTRLITQPPVLDFSPIENAPLLDKVPSYEGGNLALRTRSSF